MGLFFKKEGLKMKKLLLAATAASLISTPAFAASTDTKDFDINARVTPECSMENPSNINLGSLAIDRAPGSNALMLTEKTKSDEQEVWVSCNYVTSIFITTDNRALKTTTDVHDTAQFTDTIYYGVKFAPKTAGSFVGSDSWKPRVQPVTKEWVQTKEFHDQAVLSVTLEEVGSGKPNGKRPVAGSYTDTVYITLGTV